MDPYAESASVQRRKVYLNASALRWSERTGRPIFQWLWDDDLASRQPDEMPPEKEEKKGS